MQNAVFDILALGLPYLHSQGVIAGERPVAPARMVNGTAVADDDEFVSLLAREHLTVHVEQGPGAVAVQGAADRGMRAAYLDCGVRAASDSALEGVPALDGVRALPPLQPAGPADAHRRSLIDASGNFVSLRRYGGVDAARVRQCTMLAGSAGLLCLEDSLWDMTGGAGLAEAMVAAARRAGRHVALLCRDAETAHRNRAGICRLAESGVNFLFGEVQALMALYDYRRLDSLVPHLRLLDFGGVIWRPIHAPLVFGGDILNWRRCDPLPSADDFWRLLVPEYLEEIARTGTLEAFAPPGPPRRGNALAGIARPWTGGGESCA